MSFESHVMKCNSCYLSVYLVVIHSDLVLHAAEMWLLPRTTLFTLFEWVLHSYVGPNFFPDAMYHCPQREVPPECPLWTDPRSLQTCGKITRPPLNRIMAPLRIVRREAKLVLDNKNMPWNRKRYRLCWKATIKMAWPLALTTKHRRSKCWMGHQVWHEKVQRSWNWD